MTTIRRLTLTTFATALLFGLQGTMAWGQEYAKITAKPLIETDTSIAGEKIHYPGGAPANITAVVVTIPPGKTTGWHKHGVPLFAYILKGEATVDYGDKGKRVYKPGDSFMEAMDYWHDGGNAGKVPVDILAVYLGGPGGKLVIRKEASPEAK